MTSRRWLGLAGVAALVLLGGRIVAGLYVDYRWHAALGDGALSVWRARVSDLIAIRLVLTLAAGGFLFANLYGVSTSVDSLVLPRRLGDLEIGEKVSGRRLLWGAGVFAVLAGITLAFLVDDWMSFDLIQFARAFGVPEPYTNADLGFFLYWLPFENAVYLWAIAVLLAAAALVALLYVLTAGLRWEGGRVRTTRHVRRHLTALAAALLVILAWGHRLDGYALLWNGSGDDAAFSVIDREIVLRARFLIAAITAIASLVVLRSGWQGQSRLTFWAVSTVIAATIVLRGIVPAVQARLVAPDEFARRNAPYLRNRAALTQTAYGVNRIQRAPIAYGLPDAASVGAAVPLWDPVALTRGLERQQRGEIVVGELGWQPLGQTLAAIAVTRPAPPPEIEPRTWRVVAASAVAADASGAPVLLDSSMLRTRPPNARDRRLLSFPQASGYAVVSDTTGRVAADPVGSFWSRLAHAWDQRDLRLVLDDRMRGVDSPVIVLRRSVAERIDAIAPFFARGRAVVPLLARDTLFWTCHLYAASESFPLSQRYSVGGDTWGYFQHAGVAIVNGETGTVAIVADPAPDRLTEAWIRRFPALFVGAASLPGELLAALPPATDGVMVQAWALSQYGGRAELVAGGVHLPGGEGGDSTIGVGARALSLLPALAPVGTAAPAWTLPLLDSADRVAGILIALGGGRPVTLWMPNREASARWTDLSERLRSAVNAPSDLADARDLVRGRVHVIPVGNQLAFVQSAYTLRSDGGSTLAGVGALIDDSLRVGRTVRDALGAPRSTNAGVPGPGGTISVSPSQRALSLYETMRAALRRGDWPSFGAAFDSLGTLLARTPR